MKKIIEDIDDKFEEYQLICGEGEVEEFYNVELKVISCNCTKGLDSEFLLYGDEKTDYARSEYYLDFVKHESDIYFSVLKDLLEAWINRKTVVVSGVKTYPLDIGTCRIEICEYEII